MIEESVWSSWPHRIRKIPKRATWVLELSSGWWIGQKAAELALCLQHAVELARGVITQLFEPGQSVLKVGGVRQGSV